MTKFKIDELKIAILQKLEILKRAIARRNSKMGKKELPLVRGPGVSEKRTKMGYGLFLLEVF